MPKQVLSLPWLTEAGIELCVRRDDLLDTELSGNKFYKLFFNLESAKQQGFSRVLTFGGAWSNHLHATAAAGRRLGFETIGLVRGEESLPLNPCLQDAKNNGMRLVYLSRSDYQRKQDADFLADLAGRYQAYVIPEGGANLEGARGMYYLGQAIEKDTFDAICIACGTGTSLAGVAAGVLGSTPVYGFSVLKGPGDMAAKVRDFYQTLCDEYPKSSKLENWRLIAGFHAGGYGKKLPAYLDAFGQEFEKKTDILLDPIYTLKLFWGIRSLVEQRFWSRGSKLLVIHTGGLQGRRGFISHKRESYESSFSRVC